MPRTRELSEDRKAIIAKVKAKKNARRKAKRAKRRAEKGL